MFAPILLPTRQRIYSKTPVTFNTPYLNGENADNDSGLIGEVGAFAGITPYLSPAGAKKLLFTVEMTATAGRGRCTLTEPAPATELARATMCCSTARQDSEGRSDDD